MGCCHSRIWKNEEDWENKMIDQEGKILELVGVSLSNVKREFTIIEMVETSFLYSKFKRSDIKYSPQTRHSCG